MSFFNYCIIFVLNYSWASVDDTLSFIDSGFFAHQIRHLISDMHHHLGANMFFDNLSFSYYYNWP